MLSFCVPGFLTTPGAWVPVIAGLLCGMINVQPKTNHEEVYMSDNYPSQPFGEPERNDRPSPDSQVPYRPTERQPEPEPKK